MKSFRLPGQMLFRILLLSGFLCMGQVPPGQECALGGRITNLLTGAPVRKALVVLTSSGAAHWSRSVISDGNGRFALRGIPPDRYRLAVRREGFLPSTYGAKGPNRPGKLLVLAAGQKLEDVNFVLEPPAVISGHVFDEDAEPVQGAAVQALREDFTRGTAQYTPIGSATTNDIGEYRLFGLPSGRFFLLSGQTRVNQNGGGLVYPPVFYPATTDFAAAATVNVAAGGEARDIDLHVVKTSAVTVRGTVANLPPGAERLLQLQISRKDRARVNFGNRTSGGFNSSTGQFEFHDLTPGSYVMSGWIQDTARFLYGRQEIEVASADLDDVRFTLASGLEIPGTLKFVGGSPPAAGPQRVWLSRVESSGPTPAAAVAADSSFVLKMVTPDTWEVGVTPIPPGAYIQSIRLGEDDALTRPLTIAPTAKGPLTIVIDLRGGSVEGTVRTAGEKGSGVESATVLLVPEREYQGVVSYFKTAITDSGGHYELRGVAPGKYRLFAFEDMEPLAY
ncbi:MAG: hypothetical protein JWO80_6129, partial [Bryobacterales bacterium]|nr:hypothetical protein [Bryobacterales bacterium]